MIKDKLLHGGDYNPEQWLDRPDILKKDVEMLKEAHCNVVSMGMFSWSTLEPEEGKFNLEWLENVIDELYKNGIYTILSTPSGARPKWLADKYPEVLRVDEYRTRALFGFRHNHCYTSPIYREKVAIINRKLSEKFGKHPAVLMWHLSNEYGGECHCPLCQEAFRSWLKEKYQTIENLNSAWCTTFWSHTYNSFDQIESPSKRGETQLHALNLDWRRFVSYQTGNFIEHETKAIRDGGSDLPTVINLMYHYWGLDYFKLAKLVDIVSWDTYPTWHKKDVIETAYENGMWHDVIRSLKKQPYLQMESCPSATNWQGVSKLKKPGILFQQSMQAIAHGSDSVQYFQVRQSRGASEKFHGAIIDHYGENDTRVFAELKEVGKSLEAISEITSSQVKSSVAILYDWDNRWAMHDSQGPRNKGLHYEECLNKIYKAFRKKAINVDFVDMDCDFSEYEMLVIPMGYMFKNGFAEKVESFVKSGGKLITTYWSGIVDDTDRCYLGGTPHGLMDVLGIRSKEIDALYDWEENQVLPIKNNELGLTKNYTCKNLCDLIELRTANPILVYGSDFYAGHPVLTENNYGMGKAWYVAADADEDLYADFVASLVSKNEISCEIAGNIPKCLEITTRENENTIYYIYQNFGVEPLAIPLPKKNFEILLGDNADKIEGYSTIILKAQK